MGAKAQSISWSQVEEEWLEKQPDGGLNLAYQCLERNLAAGRSEQAALIWRSAEGQRKVFTYAELSAEALRFAAALERRGIHLAERVCTLSPRSPELYITALGTLYHGAVYAPLFSVYGPEPIRRRLEVGEARVLVTTKRLYEERVAPIRGSLPTLEHIVLLDGEAGGAESWQEFTAVPDDGAPQPTPSTGAEYPALLLFTSGTTGPPKGVLHVHRAATALLTSGYLVLGLEAGTRYWCTADPGWVTGVAYGLLAPLLCGATLIVDEGKPEPARWYAVLAEEAVQCWFTAPTALRLLRHSATSATPPMLNALHSIFSTGEPLDPAINEWTQKHLGLPTRDAWWQSETGSIMIAQYPHRRLDTYSNKHTASAADKSLSNLAQKLSDNESTPGRMGRAVPGIEMVIATVDEQRVTPISKPGQTGEILIKRGWPSMFRAYLGAPESYRQAFVDNWYRSGDLAQWDDNGELRFIGRVDDVIKTAGHMIGPAEVEAVLNHHPEVVECGVRGIPDPVDGHLVAAWVVPRHPLTNTEQLRHELIAYARQRLGNTVSPRVLHFVAKLPKTPSGKILRRELEEQT